MLLTLAMPYCCLLTGIETQELHRQPMAVGTNDTLAAVME